MRRAAIVALLFLGLAGTARAAGAPIPPAPDRWVTDGVGFLSEARKAQLDARLEVYQQKTGHQVLVWVGSTLGDSLLDDWAVKTFAAWKVGRKGIDDGLAIFLFASDRKIGIEVGYGLEDRVPDAIASRVIREVMTPRLRQDDRDGAVQAGVDAILAAIDGNPVGAESPSGEPVVGPKLGRPQAILFGVVIVIFLVLLALNPRIAMLFLWSILGGGGRRGGGSGFSGGGGRSGGGGARGSW